MHPQQLIENDQNEIENNTVPIRVLLSWMVATCQERWDNYGG